MAARTAADWIAALGLVPHPEGGFYRETYRAPELIAAEHLPPRFGGPRTFSTAIYFLLPGDQVSALHRIKSDEIWHFYAGTALTLTLIHPDGRLETPRLGPDPARGESFQTLVPTGCWYGATVDDPGSYALVGGTVAPGFDFADFELADRQTLLARFPQHRQPILQLTR
ncbi:MAG TPA: cupin domain-containing protein [Methylomirabilota bacterium]|nr:cupin domain-containing protein [Methylomirabilota bacterium]